MLHAMANICTSFSTLKVAEKHSAGLSHKILVMYLLSQDSYKIAEIFVFMDDAAYSFLELHTMTVCLISLLYWPLKEKGFLV